MLNSTLGGLIKDLRLQKGISQIDIALQLGWSEPSRLSRIEQGRVAKPSRETLGKIMDALNLTEIERNTLLLTGNYLPTEEDISKIREFTNDMINNWPYPASVLDFSWRVINQNIKTEEAYQVPKEVVGEIKKYHPRVLELILQYINQLSNFLPKEEMNNWYGFYKELLVMFRLDHRAREKEKWYTNYLKEMFRNDLFYNLWLETNEIEKPNSIIGSFTQTKLVNPKDPKKGLSFYLFLSPLIQDPRCSVQMWVPVDQETFDYYQKK